MKDSAVVIITILIVCGCILLTGILLNGYLNLTKLKSFCDERNGSVVSTMDGRKCVKLQELK